MYDLFFSPITFLSMGDIQIKMHLFELGAMIVVLLQVWLYGRLSLWGPIWGGIGTAMWITMGFMANPVMYGLIILNLILLYLQVVNYVKWSNSKKIAAAAEEQKAA